MALIVITQPNHNGLGVDLYESVRAYLRSDDDDQAVVTRLIVAVADWLAGPQGWLGRSLEPQTLELRLPGFPVHPFVGIVLPRPPLIEVESVKYLDSDGAEQALAPSTYFVSERAGLSVINLNSGESWPATACHPEAVKVRYHAGYGEYDNDYGLISTGDLPEALQLAITTAAARLYESREAGIVGNEAALRSMFAPFRVYT